VCVCVCVVGGEHENHHTAPVAPTIYICADNYTPFSWRQMLHLGTEGDERD